MKMTSQFLRDWLIYHLKLDLHLVKKFLIDNHTDANKGKLRAIYI